MKAYRLSIKDNDDAGQAIVFADTVKDAKRQVYSHDTLNDALEGGWIDLRATRDKQFDGMENAEPVEIALKQWHDGWQWFDMDFPDPDEATDDEFKAWYEANF